MTVSDNIARYIRTGVMLAIGMLVTWLASSLHVVVGPSSQAGLVTLTTGVVMAAYYALARYVEKKWPAVGKYLLGAPTDLPRVATIKTAYVEKVPPKTP